MIKFLNYQDDDIKVLYLTKEDFIIAQKDNYFLIILLLLLTIMIKILSKFLMVLILLHLLLNKIFLLLSQFSNT